MKKRILFIVVLMFSIYGFSQSLFGVRSGINISNLDFEDNPTVSNKHRNGFFVSFLAEYELSDRVLISPELQFSAEGAKFEPIRLDYIQVPIQIKYRVNDAIAFGIGPQVGIKTHKYEDSLTNIAISSIGGIEYRVTPDFFIDARYSYGFTNIFDKELNTEAKNTNIQLGVGIKF